MISEPYKIKEVKKFKTLKSYERWNELEGCPFQYISHLFGFCKFRHGVKGNVSLVTLPESRLHVG